MKRLSTLLILSFILFTSCSDKVLDANEIMGTWNWISSSGGIAGDTFTPESTGDNIILEFTRDSVYKEYLNDSLIIETDFSIIKSKSIYDHDSTKVLVLDSGMVSRSIVFESPNDLILRDEMYDGFSRHYRRIK
ncbi:MAG TPA: hypothetical protein PK335_12815 [Draconibacterium sp.]|nr:hypothetical protein [Draconibacterium sp.]